MSPLKPHMRHVAPAGYARAKDEEPEADGPRNCTPGGSQEKKAKSSKPHWWLEITALFLCICALISTIVLLFFAHGKPLVDYPSVISLNASISILATVTRVLLGFALGSCLGQWKWNWFRKRSDSLTIFESFEDASRGPWGSFILLANFKVRHWAALGALLTVVMLGFEPLLQSTIEYQGRMAASLSTSFKDSPPTLSWGDRVDAGVYRDDSSITIRKGIALPSGKAWSPRPFLCQPDIGMPIAIQSGLSPTFSSVRQTASFSCLTGNCTWPIFTSISVCSRCNDVTDHLKKETIFGKALGTINMDSQLSEDLKYIRYSLPYLNLSNPSDGINYTQRIPALMTARPISNPGRTLTFTKLDTMISAVGIIKADAAFENDSVHWRESVVTATECALFLCTKAYNSRVDGGILKEDTIASWENREPASYHALDILDDLSSSGVLNIYDGHEEAYNEIEATRNHSLVTNPFYDGTAEGSDLAVGDVTRTDLQLRIPADEAKAHGVPENVSLVFNITQNTVGSMGRFINFGIFQNGREQSSMVWPAGDSGASSQASVAQIFWNSSDLAVTFDHVALALSNWIRNSSGQQQMGNSWEYILFVRVRWVYLIIPAVVVATSSVFVLLSIRETQRLRLPAWRSNVISTLTHSLDTESRVRLRQADMKGILKATYKETTVYLDDVSDGLELKVHID